MKRPLPSSNSTSPFVIAIAGNIGSGKSSLTTLLSQNFGWKAFYEIVETNPYLQDFYAHMRRWSFHTQIFFLTKRFRHLREILSSSEPVIQDRSIYEDAEVFAKNLFLSGQMEERDYETYIEHFETMKEYVQATNLLIYLRSDTATLQQRIQTRNRHYEKQIQGSYIDRLNDQYEAWFEAYDRGPKCLIDVGRRDFVNQPEDLRQVMAIVKWEIECLQNTGQAALPLGKALRAENLGSLNTKDGSLTLTS